MVDYTNQQLINSIIRRCLIPTSQLTFTPLDLVLLANDELQGVVYPLVLSARDEYFLTFVDLLPDSNGIVDIPSDAVGAKLRNVAIVANNSGNGNFNLINLPRLDLDTIAGYGGGLYLNGNYSGITGGFYIQDNQIHLYPNNGLSQNSSIRLYYYVRSLVLAEPAAYGKITGINYDDNSVILDNVPLDWVAGNDVNIMNSQPNFKVNTPQTSITAVSSPTVFLTDVSQASVGDIVSLYGYSGIPQIPVEAHAYLAQLTAAKCLESLKALEGMKAALDKAETLKTNILQMVSNRVEGSPKKIINPSGGMLAASSINKRRGNGWGY